MSDPANADATDPVEPRSRGWLGALVAGRMPAEVIVAGESCTLEKLFKHDFFAATGLYRARRGPIVVKLARQSRFFRGRRGSLSGALLARREARLMQRAAGIAGVPACLGSVAPCGLAHDFVPGRPLQRNDRLSDAFFPQLAELVAALHARDMAYVDLEKRENILLGDDGRPHLIDYQISYAAPRGPLGRLSPRRWMLALLQSADRYHLAKHWRRLRPDQLVGRENDPALRPPIYIRLHRAIFRPLIVARRRVLYWLGARESTQGRSEEENAAKATQGVRPCP